ncbi:MAG: transglycosylase SLT domain-containing protein [Clostridia bacterium]|nr:transglycosylase SLT domain-containing protein [Clostridia bacterium]
MSFYTKYSICMVCTLTAFFIAAFLLGNYIRANGYDVEAAEIEETATGTIKVTQKIIPSTNTKEDEQIREFINQYYDISLSSEKQEYVFALCDKYSVPRELVLAVMCAESNYENNRISDNGDWGIMQINTVNHEWLKAELGVTDFLDFYDNVHCGVYMLSAYYHKYADVNKITMCYRYGESGAKEMWEMGVYETEYTKQIIRNIAALKY